MAPTQHLNLPILPLPRGVVLFPGSQQRIQLRPDEAESKHLARLISSRLIKTPGGVPIACVPLATSASNSPPGLNQDSPDEVEAFLENDEAPSGKELDLFSCGTAARVTAVHGSSGEPTTIVVVAVGRLRIEEVKQHKSLLQGRFTYVKDEPLKHDASIETLFNELKSLSRQLMATYDATSALQRLVQGIWLNTQMRKTLDAFISSSTVDRAGALADFIAPYTESSYEDKLQILSSFDVKNRVEKVVDLLRKQMGDDTNNNLEITTVTAHIMPFPLGPASPGTELIRQPRRRPSLPGRNSGTLFGLPAGRMPGGSGQPASGDSEEDDDLADLRKRLETAKLSSEAAKMATKELKRLEKMMPVQAEYSIIRNYLETLSEIPWSVMTDDRLDRNTLSRARKQLDDDHYGLEKVKKRLLEYLAVLRLKQSSNLTVDERVEAPGIGDSTPLPGPGVDTLIEQPSSSEKRRRVDKSPILLLVGPPGVGKTSLAKSVATALGRKFHRISLGGVRDEAEIRGHRRTYVAAMPGVIVQGLRKVGVANPVILLDEIDKLGTSNFHGDPSAAMLEVLDPEQNNTFVDHYVNLPIDLSKTLFIATANSLDTIPGPLLDRMEMVHLSGYTTLEKRQIATRHLIPKQITTNGLEQENITFDQDVVSKIIESYTREAGVRNLEREIGSVCRAKAVEYAEAQDNPELTTYSAALTPDDIEHILGSPKFEEEIAETTGQPGIVTGLVAYSSGGNGSILFIEVASMPGNGTVQLTGKLGSVLKESVEVALSWVKAHAFELGIAQSPGENIMKERSIHVHCPSGAIPKDGPSSGIGQAVALISLFSGRVVPPTMAMTGEISLRGRITAVGGIKEKLIGALRAGVKTVLLPDANRKDIKDLPQEVKDGLEIVHVSHIHEALQVIWPEAQWPGQESLARFESRL